MRYPHTSLDLKRAAVEKLDGIGDNFVTVADFRLLALLGVTGSNSSTTEQASLCES